MSDEALKTAKIEGEILDRDSLQSSIRRNFGLAADNRKVTPAEQGIAEMMINLYDTFNQPLTEKVMFEWHKKLMLGRHDLNRIGKYRTDEDPMQIVSGAINRPKVHFEAPPSECLTIEMKRFVSWFNIGTGTVIVPPAICFCIIIWLPFCRAGKNPASFRIRTTSAPENIPSLGTNDFNMGEQRGLL